MNQKTSLWLTEFAESLIVSTARLKGNCAQVADPATLSKAAKPSAPDALIQILLQNYVRTADLGT